MAFSFSFAVLLVFLILGGALVEATARSGLMHSNTSKNEVEKVEDRVTIPSFLLDFASPLDSEKTEQYAEFLQKNILGERSTEFCKEAKLVCDSNIAIDDPGFKEPDDGLEDGELVKETRTELDPEQDKEFGSQDVIKEGDEVTLPENFQDSAWPTAAFLPDSLAEKMPFSSDQENVLLNTLHIDPDSNLANLMSRTLNQCETSGKAGQNKEPPKDNNGKGIDDEKQEDYKEHGKCVTSLKDMVSFVENSFPSENRINALDRSSFFKPDESKKDNGGEEGSKKGTGVKKENWKEIDAKKEGSKKVGAKKVDSQTEGRKEVSEKVEWKEVDAKKGSWKEVDSKDEGCKEVDGGKVVGKDVDVKKDAYKKVDVKETEWQKEEVKKEGFKQVDVQKGGWKEEEVKKEGFKEVEVKKGAWKEGAVKKGDWKEEEVKKEGFKEVEVKKGAWKEEDGKKWVKEGMDNEKGGWKEIHATKGWKQVETKKRVWKEVGGKEKGWKEVGGKEKGWKEVDAKKGGFKEVDVKKEEFKETDTREEGWKKVQKKSSTETKTKKKAEKAVGINKQDWVKVESKGKSEKVVDVKKKDTVEVQTGKKCWKEVDGKRAGEKEVDVKKVSWKVVEFKKHKKAVVCKKSFFAFAVFKCYDISKINNWTIYNMKLEGKDGVYRKEVAICHHLEVDSKASKKYKVKRHKGSYGKATSVDTRACYWVTNSLIWAPAI